MVTSKNSSVQILGGQMELDITFSNIHLAFNPFYRLAKSANDALFHHVI